MTLRSLPKSAAAGNSRQSERRTALSYIAAPSIIGAKSFHENCQPFCVISKIQKMRVLRNERSVRNERRRYSHVHQTDGHGLALKRLSCFGFFGFGSDSFKSAMTNVAGASAFDGIGIGAIGVSWFCSLMR